MVYTLKISHTLHPPELTLHFPHALEKWDRKCTSRSEAEQPNGQGKYSKGKIMAGRSQSWNLKMCSDTKLIFVGSLK